MPRQTPSQRVHALLSLDFETSLYIRRNRAPDWRRNVADFMVTIFEIREALGAWFCQVPSGPRSGHRRRSQAMASATARNFFRAGKKVRLHQLTPPITYLFPQIVAIGRNYAEHVKELNNATPTEPFFFLKPTTSYLPSGGTLEIPRGIIAHHEGTLAINSSCLPSPLNAHSRTRPHHIKTWPGHPPL